MIAHNKIVNTNFFSSPLKNLKIANQSFVRNFETDNRTQSSNGLNIIFHIYHMSFDNSSVHCFSYSVS